MVTFLMFGKYTGPGLAEMSPERTQKATELIKKLGGKVEAMYATLGANDLVFVLSLPDNQAAIKASVVMSKMSGISFCTAPAVTVAEFDKLMSEV